MAVILFVIKCIQDKWSFIKHSDSNQSRQIPEKEKTSFHRKRGRNAGFGIYPPLVRCSLEQRRKPLSRKNDVLAKANFFEFRENMPPLFRIGAVPHRAVVGIVANHRFQPLEKFYHVNNAAGSKPERTGDSQYKNDIEFPLPQKLPTFL